MRSLVALAIGSAALTLAACGAGSSSGPDVTLPSGTGTAVSASTAAEAPAYDGPTIPTGAYTKEVTLKQIHRLGIELGVDDVMKFDPDQLSADGTGLVVYKFAQDEWTQFSGPDADHLLPGSFGTQTYDEDGNLVISEPCCGDSTLTWSWDGRALKMVMIKSPIVKVVPMDHLMRDGTYTKTG